MPSNLQTYMEERTSLYYQVNLKDFVEKFRKNNEDLDLVIVVDGPSLIKNLYKDLNPFCGGQYQAFCRNVEKFVDAFEALGVELVVFFNATVVKTRNNIFVERQYNAVQKFEGLMDKLDEGDYVNDGSVHCIPTSLSGNARFIFKEFCQVIMSADKECTEEIIQYANANNCIAIISQNSDFAVAPGDWCYLSADKIDLEKMTTYLYDTDALAAELNLKDVGQLPLMGSLLGNSLITIKTLIAWYRRLCNTRRGYVNFNEYYPEVAKYVRQFPSGCDVFPHLRQISSTVFGDSTQANSLKDSMMIYLALTPTPSSPSSGDPEWDKTLKQIKSFMKTGQARGLLVFAPQHEAMTLEDFRKEDIPPSGNFWRPLRSKVYGIVLQNCPLKRPVVEFFMTGLGSLDAPVYVEPVPPQEPHPGLLALWSDDRELDDCRWNLFTSTWSPDIPVGRLRDLPLRLVTAVLVITYMLKPCRLDDFEWQSLLMTADVCSEGPVPPEVEADTNVPIDTRALRLSTVYIRGVSLVGMLTSACGFPVPFDMTFIWNLFDGLLFQKYYRERELLLPVENSDLKIAFDFINDYSGLFT